MAFATDGGRAEAMVTPRDDPVWALGQHVPVVYDPGWPEHAVRAEDARWFSGPWPWLLWVAGIALAVTFARLFHKQHSALQGAARAHLDVATVATMLGVGGGTTGDERNDLLLRLPQSGQRPERRLVFAPRSMRARRRLVHEDQVVMFGDPLVGAHVVVQTADGQVLLPRGPLRLPE